MTPLKPRLERWAIWSLGGGTANSYPSMAAFWRIRVQQAMCGSAPLDSDAEKVEAAVAWMRKSRTDLYVVIVAEYLNVLPDIHPEAWRTAYRQQGKLAWLLDCLKREAGVTMRYHGAPGRTSDERHGFFSHALGMSVRTYRTRLAEAHTFLGVYLDFADRGKLLVA